MDPLPGYRFVESQRYLEKLGRDRPSDVIVVILTDGMENASRKWTARQVFDLITEAEDSGWQFVFLGANQDSWSVAQNMGIRKGAVVDWAPNPMSHKEAMAEASNATRDYRALKQQQTRYRDRRTK